MRLGTVTHANTGEKVVVDWDMIAYIYHSAAAAATMLHAGAGAVMPVKESVTQCEQLKQGEKTNGKRKTS